MVRLRFSGTGLDAVGDTGEDDAHIARLAERGLERGRGDGHQEVGLVGPHGGHDAGERAHVALGVERLEHEVAAFDEAAAHESVLEALETFLAEGGLVVGDDAELPWFGGRSRSLRGFGSRGAGGGGGRLGGDGALHSGRFDR